MAETIEVPFITVGNRRCLTDEQLMEHPYLHDFVKRFPNSFERDVNLSVWWFIEPEMTNG